MAEVHPLTTSTHQVASAAIDVAVRLAESQRTIRALLAALRECEDHFDRYCDAEIDDTGTTRGNPEMHMLGMVRDAIAKAGA